MTDSSKVVDVIVVGAGLAGLVAADYLLSRDSNLSVTVLEAADKLGGRTTSQVKASFCFNVFKYSKKKRDYNDCKSNY